MGDTILVLGGARSGKSRHAQALAEAGGKAAIYVATAQALDGEMADRIARHRADRDSRWQTVEAPVALAEALAMHDGADRVMLVDCLTLWLTNLLLADMDLEAHGAALADTIAALRGDVILVANEVGLGIVPDNALARRFRDAAGLLNQRLAGVCAKVDLVTAGLPLRLKGA
jgi:adenosylcobinamide kinase/adenosylcobinamide-phosphate guanylyltransferase